MIQVKHLPMEGSPSAWRLLIIGSTLFDIEYKGKRIEEKATAYYHSWRGDNEYSNVRTFSIAETVGQHNEREPIPVRHNDAYVFCLNTG